MVIEGTLALTGQHFITRAFEERGSARLRRGLPARRGRRAPASRTARGSYSGRPPTQGLRRRIADRLLTLLPVTAGVLVPPGADPADWTLLGYGAEEINTSRSPRSRAGSRSSVWTSPPRRVTKASNAAPRGGAKALAARG